MQNLLLQHRSTLGSGIVGMYGPPLCRKRKMEIGK